MPDVPTRSYLHGQSREAVGGEWKKWLYSTWNERLVAYCFRNSEDSESEFVERIPATPEELVEIVGDSDADPDEVVRVFVASVKRKLVLNSASFKTFCQNYAGWTPGSERSPSFFAALWLTCLVAYGYPREGSSGFHDRVKDVLGASQQMDFLPAVWRDLEEWTAIRAVKETGFKPLLLPPEDSYRTNIGYSWFLAFPHHHDRLRLRELLERADLVGDEPPVEPVIRLLRQNKNRFGESFRKDFEVFSENFLLTGIEVRNSPFWRAVRQEALAPTTEVVSAGRRVKERQPDLDAAMMAEIDDDDLYVYVACSDEARLPPGYSVRDFGYELDGFSNYVVSDADGLSDDEGSDHAARAAMEGDLQVPKVRLYARRGVLVFQEVITNEYRLAGGAEANQAEVALVRNDLVEVFKREYGGRTRPSHLAGWHQVTGCKVLIRPNAPRGLERAKHLQETMVPPSVRLVGGIRTGDGFYAFPGFLPKIRFDGATRVEISDERGALVCLARRSSREHDEWELPEIVRDEAPCRLTVRVHWRDKADMPRTSETKLVFLDRTADHNYKPFSAGLTSKDFASSVPSGQRSQRRGASLVRSEIVRMVEGSSLSIAITLGNHSQGGSRNPRAAPTSSATSITRSSSAEGTTPISEARTRPPARKATNPGRLAETTDAFLF